jgi:hypothetical protein
MTGETYIYTDQLKEFHEEYDRVGLLLVNAVGIDADKDEIDRLKRQLETLASQIRKMDVNRRL